MAAFAGFGLTIASVEDPARFGQLPQYLASSSNNSFCRLAQLIIPCNAGNDQ